MNGRGRPTLAFDPEGIGARAGRCLILALETDPKPGLASHLTRGSREDLDEATLRVGATALPPFFARLAAAGSADAPMEDLRAIGVEAEAAVLAATRGVRLYGGAIFGLGLLCAAAGFRARVEQEPIGLGEVVRRRWGRHIAEGPVTLHSPGTRAARLHGAPGMRGEAAAGFPTLYDTVLPALAAGALLSPHDAEAARVHATLALMAVLKDTALLQDGGSAGLSFVRSQASAFMRAGGIARAGWRLDAAFIHAEYVKRGLSPAGSANLLAMGLFAQAVDQSEEKWPGSCEADRA